MIPFKTIAHVTSPCIQRFGPGMIVGVDLFLACVDHCAGIAGTVVRIRAACERVLRSATDFLPARSPLPLSKSR